MKNALNKRSGLSVYKIYNSPTDNECVVIEGYFYSEKEKQFIQFEVELFKEDFSFCGFLSIDYKNDLTVTDIDDLRNDIRKEINLAMLLGLEDLI